jgi:serine/threonine-protein kinase RsbW
MVTWMDDHTVASRRDSSQHFNSFRVKALLENVPLAMDCVTRWVKALGLDDHALYEIQLAVDEACANVVHHAYQGVEPGDMEIACSVNDQILTIQVRDWGRGFNPCDVSEPDVDAPLAERTLGGLGLFLLKQIMDSVQFTFDSQHGNELVMTKRVQIAG